MTPEQRFERIETDLQTVTGLLVQVTDRLDQVTDRLDSMTAVLDGMSVRLDAISARLDRAVRLGVREARNERRKRRELDERLTRLTVTVQAFIDSMTRGGNGHT